MLVVVSHTFYISLLKQSKNVSVAAAAKNKYVAYGSLYLTVPGVYATAPVLSAWMANNSEPHYRRASSIAFGFVATNAVSQIYTMYVKFLT